MNERKTSMVDSARRLAELRQGKSEPSARFATAHSAPAQHAPEFAEDEESGREEGAFSQISADRQQKVMVEFRLLNGNAKALAYSYLVAADFDPSEGIKLDFSGYAVAITGRNLRPLFSGLVSQRVAVVREMDGLHAEVNLREEATIVTGIKVTEVE